jgi:hypothetical protein
MPVPAPLPIPAPAPAPALSLRSSTTAIAIIELESDHDGWLSKSIKKILTGGQQKVFKVIEKTVWEMVIFRLPFMSTPKNSVVIQDHFREL